MADKELTVRFKRIAGNSDNHFLEMGYLVSLPIILFYLYRFSPFNNFDGYLDSWIYFAYTHNFSDLIERYGFPYYAVRFGLIFPLILMTKLLGPVYGYIAFIYSMYLLAGIPLYLVFRKHFSIHAAILAYSILISSLWLARAVLWTHPDASAVPYLIAALSIVLLQPQYRRTAMFAVGALIALAVNSNFFALSIGGLIGVPYLIIYRQNWLKNLRLDIPWLFTGFISIFVAGSAGYYMCCNQYNYLTNTLNMVKWSADGGGIVYAVPLKAIVSYPYNWLLPLLLVAMLFLLRNVDKKSRQLILAVTCYLFSVVVFVIAYQLYSKTAIIETFYYYSFMIVPAIFCIGIIPVILARASGSEKMYTYLGMASFLFPGLLISFEIVDMATIPFYVAFLLCALLLILIILATIFKKIIPCAILTLGITLATIWPVAENIGQFNYSLYGQSEKIGMSRYKLGLQFISLMPRYKESKKPIYFWYRHSDQLANSLQSTYLWGYSRIMDSAVDTPGIPDLKNVNYTLLENPSSLVLFDRDEDVVAQGIKTLTDAGLRFSIRSTQSICEEDLCYTIAVLDSKGFETETETKWKGNDLTLVDYELNWHVSGYENISDKDQMLFSVNTQPVPWEYAAVGSVKYFGQMPSQAGVVRLVVYVSGSNAGIGFTGDNQSEYITRLEVQPSNEAQEYYFAIDNLSEVRNLIISGWDSHASARVDIIELEIKGYPKWVKSAIQQLWDEEQYTSLEFNLEWYVPGSSANIEVMDNLVTINTSGNPWQYNAIGAITYTDIIPARMAIVRVLLSVQGGSAGIGFTGVDHSEFIRRTEVHPRSDVQELFFQFDNISEIKNIIVSDWDKHTTAIVELHELEIRLH